MRTTAASASLWMRSSCGNVSSLHCTQRPIHSETIGNSFGIIIDRAILDVLGITRETPLDVTARDGGLFIRPLDAAE